MSFFGALKKLSIKKVVATVQKTVKDATNITAGFASGGVAGALGQIGALKKDTSLTPTTIYGSDAAAAAANNANASAAGGGTSNMPLLIGGAILLVLLFMAKR